MLGNRFKRKKTDQNEETYPMDVNSDVANGERCPFKTIDSMYGVAAPLTLNSTLCNITIYLLICGLYTFIITETSAVPHFVHIQLFSIK